ncbi:MAG: RraA family protein [Rhodospirillales bacterium]|nr:RraA family protein [Rhodospirillales bacterium]
MSVSDDILQAFAVLATPTIANALDDVAFEGVMQGLMQAVPGTRCVGRAVTIRQITGRRGDFASADFRVGHLVDAAGHGDILVIDNGGQCVSTFGGLATLAAKMKGIGGLVADGGVRDREEMMEHRFPVFARHMTPLTGRTRLAITGINEPISCGGVRVRPGDVIVADGSGVVCIPAEHAAQVAELAARYANDDDQAAVELSKGLSFREAMAKFGRI